MNTSTMMWQVAQSDAPVDDRAQMTTKGLTIDDLIARCHEYDQHKRDYEVKATDVQLRPEGGFRVIGSDGVFQMEIDAVAQMGAKYGIPFFDASIPRHYMAAEIEQNPDLYGQILARHAERYGKTLYLRTYGENTVRAVLSDRYTHVNNRELLDYLKRFLDEKGGGTYTLVRPYVGRDELHVRVLVSDIFPQGGDSPYGMGFVLRGGEIGNRSLQVWPFIQRGTCENSTVGVEGGVKEMQSGNRQLKLMSIAAAMGKALEASEELVTRMMEAQYEELPNLPQIVSRMAKENKWSEAVPLVVMQGTEGQNSLFGLVNGLTYAAHRTQMFAQDALSMEIMAGQVLMGGVRKLNK
jgi:hypothetical protein